jgi:catechol 2,3-dioxygenase-like lactoylglutathione lyase family enzyme
MSTHSGINHIEFWVTNLARSSAFYTPVLGAIGWRKLTDSEFSSGSTVLFLVEKIVPKADSVGPRHICFQANSRNSVDAVAKILHDQKATILRGPVEMPNYSASYYTVDFRDPDGYVIEVAHTPNMTF